MVNILFAAQNCGFQSVCQKKSLCHDSFSQCSIGFLGRLCGWGLWRHVATLAGVGLFYAVFGIGANDCYGGLTASEVVVVVNGNSLNSRTLANHFVSMRGIPSVNVVVLDSVPNSETTDVQIFRERILRPLIEEINNRGLAGHIQCIAYSADFPTAINLRQDLTRIKDLHHVFTPVGSINGMTYLYELTLTENPGYLAAEINHYARRPMDSYFSNPAGGLTAPAWEAILSSIEAKNFSQAVEQLQQLCSLLPHQYPMRYLAAACAAMDGQSEVAVRLLGEAIDEGWSSGGYLASDERFASLRDNDDFQLLEISLDKDSGRWQPTVGFNSRAHWAPNGIRFLSPAGAPAPGMRYLMCVVLGVTRGGGTTLQEAIDALERSTQADSTHPEGTFFFSSTSNVRTQTREPLFADAIEELERIGFKGSVVPSRLPSRQRAVLGAQIGSPVFDWSTSRSTLVPGSIAENLTSLGGVMASTGGQTKLTEFIKAGAAGSSGTVTEPYSVPFKFPSPMLYVHYAKGSSLAEAFYQSVTGPYQLLIVGDPLCQPFSIAPRPELDDSLRMVEAGQRLTLNLDLNGLNYSQWLAEPLGSEQRKQPLAPSRIAVQVDGGAPRGGVVQSEVSLELDGLADGYHEIQVLLIADDPINQRSVKTLPIWIGPENLIGLSLGGSGSSLAPTAGEAMPDVSFQSESLVMTINVPEGCQDLSLWHHSEQVLVNNSPQYPSTQVVIGLDRLGMGPIRLQAKATLSDGRIIASQPLRFNVVP